MTAGDHGWRPFEPSIEAVFDALVARIIAGIVEDARAVIPPDMTIEIDPNDPHSVIVTYTETRPLHEVVFHHTVTV